MVRRAFSRLWSDAAGSVAIETAIVTPVLLLMSLGAFQISAVVARQNELQSAAAEAEAIAMAAPVAESTIEAIIMTSAGLTSAQVEVDTVYRCSNDPDFTADPATCASAAETSTFLKIYMTDSYAPKWVEFGLGEALTYHVTRTVQLS